MCSLLFDEYKPCLLHYHIHNIASLSVACRLWLIDSLQCWTLTYNSFVAPNVTTWKCETRRNTAGNQRNYWTSWQISTCILTRAASSLKPLLTTRWVHQKCMLEFMFSMHHGICYSQCIMGFVILHAPWNQLFSPSCDLLLSIQIYYVLFGICLGSTATMHVYI